MKVSWMSIPDFQERMRKAAPHDALPQVINRVLDNICQDDLNELEMLGETPEVVFRAEDVHIGFIDGKAVCLFGFEIHMPGDWEEDPWIIPWMIGTGEYGTGARRRKFFSAARFLVEQIDKPMFNIVSVDHTDAQRFIRHLGFTIETDAPVIHNGNKFWRFTRNV